MSLENLQLGGYRLISLLGKGGMAEVWLGEQLRLNRQVAIKIISETSPLADTGHLVERFEREAHSIARLDHPNILSVLDYGKAEGYLYLVMPYVRQGSLQNWLRHETLSRTQAFSLFEQVLSALSYAHRAGIVHRDLKPGNILLHEDGRVLLADFGLAKPLNDNLGLTAIGAVVGSPEYMAPEQFMGYADYRSDLYSMGVILYRLLTGRALYSGTSAMELGMNHLNAPLPLPTPLIPSALEPFLAKALHKRPEHRFATAEEMAGAFHYAVQLLSLAELQVQPSRPGMPGATPVPPKPPVFEPPSLPPTAPLPSDHQRTATMAATPASPIPGNISQSGASPVPPQGPVAEKKKGRLPLLIAGGVLALVVLIAGGLIIASSGTKPATPVSVATATLIPEVASSVPPQTPAQTSRVATTPAQPTALPTATLRASQPTVIKSTPVIPIAAPIPLSSVNLAGGHSGPVNAVSWSNNGSAFVTGSDDKTLRVWDAATQKVTLVLDDKTRPQKGAIVAAVWSSDGNYIVSASADKFVTIYDAKTGGVLIQFSDGVAPRAVAIAPDNGLVPYPGPGVLHSWNFKGDGDGPNFPLSQPDAEVTALVFSPDGKYLAIGLNTDRVDLWDVKAVKLQLFIDASSPTKDPVTTLLWNADGTGLMIGREHSFSIQRLDLSASGAVATASAQAVTAPVSTFAISSDGKVLAAGSQNGEVQLWGLEDNKQIGQFSTGKNPIIGLRWTAQNQQIEVMSGGSQPVLAAFSKNIPPPPTPAPVPTAVPTPTVVATPARSIKVTVRPMSGTQVGGVAELTEATDGNIKVVITATNLLPGVHHAHIHEGSCLAQGPIIFPLLDLVAGADGKATNTTIIKADFASVTSGRYYVNIHNETGTPTYVAGCGEISG